MDATTVNVIICIRRTHPYKGRTHPYKGRTYPYKGILIPVQGNKDGH
jgi:hypothetical protein